MAGGCFHLSPRCWPSGSHRPRVLGTWGFKESRSVLSPDPEGPESLESFHCHLQASVPTPGVPQDPPCCLPFRIPPRPPPGRAPPQGPFLPAQGCPPAPGAAHRHPPGAAGWTSASCRASSGGPGPLPVGGHKVRAEACGVGPGPSLTIVRSWWEGWRQEVRKEAVPAADPGRQAVNGEVRKRRRREGAASAPDQLSDFTSRHPSGFQPVRAGSSPTHSS